MYYATIIFNDGRVLNNVLLGDFPSGADAKNVAEGMYSNAKEISIDFKGKIGL